jgi:hypothetical protein
MYGLGLGRMGLASRNAGFSPSKLFALGEVGAWYDPSDLSTMFTDRAGTAPVATVGTVADQTVGLILDKSEGATIGPELVTNGDLSNGTTGWNAVNSSVLSVSSGMLRVTNGAAAYGLGSQGFTTIVGNTYRVSFTKGITSGGSSYVHVGSTAGGTDILGNVSDSNFVFVAITTSSYLNFTAVSNTISSWAEWDNISVKEIAGNHATAPSDAARPLLSARVNLCVATENVGDANWVAFDSTKTANGVTFSANTTSCLQQLPFIPGGSANATVTVSATVSCASGTVNFRMKCTHSAVADYFGPEVVATTTPTRFTFTKTFGAGAGSGQATGGVVNSATSPAIATLIVENLQLELGSTATPYQRVNTASDYNGVGFPHYLKFDGVDDTLSTAAIDFTGTDKATQFLGAWSLSTATQMLYELGPNVLASFSEFIDGGVVTYAGVQGATGGASPNAASDTKVKRVTTQTSDAASVTAVGASTLRFNAVAQTMNTGGVAPGGGNFGNLAFYVASRAGSSLFYSGNLYSLIIRGAASTTPEIESTESWVANKTGVTL